jgi:glycosyltransferase involved in cell wall biosynthesis
MAANDNSGSHQQNYTKGTALLVALNTKYKDIPRPRIIINGVGRFLTRTYHIVKHLGQYYEFRLVDFKHECTEGETGDLIWSVYHGPNGKYATKLMSKLGAPCIATMRGEFWDILAKKSTNKQLEMNLHYYRNATRIVPVCTLLKDRLCEKFPGFKDKKFTVIPNGHFINQIPKDAVPSYRALGNPLVGAVTSFPFPDKVKGLIEIVLEVGGNTNFKGTLVTAGTEGNKFSLPCGSLFPNVHHLGPIADIYNFYKSLDLYIHSSYRDGQASAVMEAMSCGVPVILVDHPANGTREFIGHGKTGFIVDTVKEAVQLASELLQNKEYLKTIGHKAQTYLSTHYSWRDLAMKYKAVFDQELI